jgi:hypothetical protein
MTTKISHSLILVAAVAWNHAYARTSYPGQYAQYSDQERAWFKAVRSPRGVPCCDIADGHKTTWKHGESETGYVVAIDNRDEPSGTEWVPVPQDALIIDTSDPEGDTVVWYVEQEGHTDENGQRHRKFYIRCFVPGRGA